MKKWSLDMDTKIGVGKKCFKREKEVGKTMRKN